MLRQLSNPRPFFQSLCFRIQKMMEAYRPDWCETREDWSVYLFSPQNKWVCWVFYLIILKFVLWSKEELFLSVIPSVNRMD